MRMGGFFERSTIGLTSNMTPQGTDFNVLWVSTLGECFVDLSGTLLDPTKQDVLNGF